LPFTRHPDDEDALEERWLFEAMSECYLPLIIAYDELIEEKINFKITMSITPTLMTMLQDEYLNKRYFEYLKKSIELSEKELIRTENSAELYRVSNFYNKRFKDLLATYEKYDYRIMNAFKRFDKLGFLEIITSSATHGLLPLLIVNKETVRAQISTAVQSYSECLGHAPKGIWLPECAYTYELDSILKEYGLEYFIGENTAVLHACPKPNYGTYAPISSNNGVVVFGRDIESSHQVWSNYMGYPGDVNYREFYRDIGHELDMTYVAPYINQNGIRVDTGIKYYKITGATENKDIYNRNKAMEVVKQHAEHFRKSREFQINRVSEHMSVKPIITCPYDTELFGHWWFEGTDFIKEFIKSVSKEVTNFKMITPSKYLEKYPIVQCCIPAASTWGENGDFSVWLNHTNDWIYREIHKCARRMVDLADKYKEPEALIKRALNQAARELMLAEASDWSFIMKNDTTVNYAIKRVKNHVERFNTLYIEILNDKVDSDELSKIEEIDNIFENINYEIYRSNTNAIKE
jgi:1,4-alpha-glucan branching enzyme